jgi:hypothetical protein
MQMQHVVRSGLKRTFPEQIRSSPLGPQAEVGDFDCTGEQYLANYHQDVRQLS